MGKVYVGDLLRIGHKLWYRVGCGPGMPGPYRVVEDELGGIGKVRGRHVCRPYGWAVWWVIWVIIFSTSAVSCCGKLLQFVPYYNSIKTTHLK